MKKENHNRKKNSITILGLILIFILAMPVGYGIGKGVKAHTGTTSKIKKSLENNCNCEAVEFSFSSFGFHISKEDGVNNKTASFVITNRSLENSFKEEASRLYSIVKSEIPTYDELDLITLHFKTDNASGTIKIINGSIQ